jgi:hypothetical protein
MSEEIEIKCKTDDRLDWHLLTDFQGNLKTRDDYQLTKLANSIKRNGFLFPFFVWSDSQNYYTLDGHGRLAALKLLENDGYVIGPVPVCYINAKDRSEAKRALLQLNSRYGKITPEGFDEFTADFDYDIDEFEIPEIDDLCVKGDSKEPNEIEIKPYNKAHYLLSVDIDKVDTIADIIHALEETDGVEVDYGSN